MTKVIYIYIYIYTRVCMHTQMYQKFYFSLLAKNRFRVSHSMFVSNSKVFACPCVR